MSTLGTIALSFAIPVYLLVLHALFSIPKSSSSDRMTSDAAILATLALAVLWVFLGIALVAATVAGRFEWVASNRALQFVFTLASHTAAGIVTGFSIVQRHRPVSTVPWVLRPITPWAAFVLPPLVLLGALLALHPPLGSFVPQQWLRGTLTAAGILSLLATACLLGGLCSRRSPPQP